MTEEALKRKKNELTGVKKQASELLEVAWVKGYVVGCEDGRKSAISHGEWVDCEDNNYCKCSNCGYIVMREEVTSYCGTCGARMEKEGEAE